MELEDDDDVFRLVDQDYDGVLQSPFAQTSLTPPPASSVLRHSVSSHRLFGGGANECEPIFISAAATVTDLQQRAGGGGAPLDRFNTRRSSQLMPVPKDFIDSGCDSMGGHEPYATASNATTLNHNNQGSLQPNLNTTFSNLAQYNTGPSQYPGFPTYDYDRRMTLSTYDNGPTIVSMAQVQKVDLEGLRQSHHHHQSPTHTHPFGMVAVEAPFA
jgi:hypothetical protein